VSRCPSQDWDRYIAAQDAPMPVGEPRIARSKKEHYCEACAGVIPAGASHMMQSYVSDVGLFISPERTHLRGQCLPVETDW
jgi:hypothetical protein